MRTTHGAAMAVLLGITIAVGCRGDRAAAHGDSVRYITIAAPPDTLIDMASGVIGEVADLYVHDDGRVFASDPQVNGVHVFDGSGRHVHTIGREGEGPGEFRRPAGLQMLGDSLVVVDEGNGRLQLLSPTGVPYSTRPVQPMYSLTVGRTGIVVRSTLGINSVLAVIYGMDGRERARLGEVLAPPSRRVDPVRMKQEIANGEVPAVFLNDARSVVDDDGHVWLYVPAAARVERYDPAGARLLSVHLADPEFEAVHTRFVSRNAELGPGNFFPLRYLLRARVVGPELWLLIDAGPEGPATILVLSAEGEVRRRMRFRHVDEPGDFAVDGRHGLVYFYIPGSAELLRVPVDVTG